MLKVLHVYRTYLPETYGGLEQAISQICASTKHLGVANRILTLTKTDTVCAIERPEAIVFLHGCSLEVASCGFSFSAMTCFKKHVNWADVIHYHFPWPFSDILHLIHRVNKPCLVTYHSDIIRQRLLGIVYRPLRHFFLRSMQRIIATSENYLNTSKVLKRYKDKVRVIPFGLDPACYNDPEPSRLNYWRMRLGHNFFLFVGVLRYYKGLHILLDAIKNAPFKIVLVGSGPVEHELKAKAERLRLNNVFFLGFLPDCDKMALFELCRAVVFPSHLRSEAFGITLLEALMKGRPIISSEIGTGTSFVNQNEVTGLVVEPGNPVSLRSAMNLLFNDDNMVQKMGKNARERFEKYFTASRMGRAYFDQYQELLGNNSLKKANHEFF